MITINTIIDVFSKEKSCQYLRHSNFYELESKDIPLFFEEYDIIINHYENYRHNNVLSINNYIDYLFIREISNTRKIENKIHVDKINEFKQKSQFFGEIEKKFNKINIFKFINENIAVICSDEQNILLIIATIKLSANSNYDIDIETFRYLIKNHYYLMLDNFDLFTGIFKKYPTLITELLCEEIVLENVNSRLGLLCNIICSHKENKKISSSINHILNIIIEYGKESINNITIDNVFKNDTEIRLIYDMLKKIKNPIAHDFEEGVRKSQLLIDQSIKINGSTFSYEIPKELIHALKKSDLPPEIKILGLTHSPDNELKKTVHCFENIVKISEPYFLKLIFTNVPTNDYFTFSLQKNLGFHIQIYLCQFYLYFQKKEDLKEYFHYIKLFLCFVFEYLNVDITQESIEADLDMLYLMVDDLFFTYDDNYPLRIKTSVYGASTFTCALIEKILRIIYKEENKGKVYWNDNFIGLGDLLDYDKSHEIKKILGENHTKCLRYYLITDKNSGIGRNIRNSLAHWNNFDKNNLNKDLLVLLMWLFTGVVNSLFLEYKEQLIKSKK